MLCQLANYQSTVDNPMCFKVSAIALETEASAGTFWRGIPERKLPQQLSGHFDKKFNRISFRRLINLNGSHLRPNSMTSRFFQCKKEVKVAVIILKNKIQ